MRDKLARLQRLALSQIAHVWPGTPSAALEICYGVVPLDLQVEYTAQAAAIRVKPDTSDLPPAKPKGRTAHARHLESHFPAGLWQIETDECCKEKAWSKNYKDGFPKHKVDMLPKGDLDAYTDGSLMAGRSGAGAVTYEKRQAICHVRSNTGAATVYQSERLGIKAAADVLLSFMGRSIVFHVDNQATLQSLDGNDITKNCARLAREALNKLGTNERVHLDWCRAYVGAEE
jgi:hypothetical protein